MIRILEQGLPLLISQEEPLKKVRSRSALLTNHGHCSEPKAQWRRLAGQAVVNVAAPGIPEARSVATGGGSPVCIAGTTMTR